MEKRAKNSRILDMYVRLCEGKTINKREEAGKFGVDERTVQRDLDDIRAFLSERRQKEADMRTVVYNRSMEGFVMDGTEGSLMSNDEILAVSKILLESRAFTKKEINAILDKLIAGCVPYKNMWLVTKLLSNERYHYVELHHKSNIGDKLWQVGGKIQECKLLEISYEKKLPVQETVMRVVRPVAIIFSEYYFYLIAFIVEKNDEQKYELKYDYPAVFRIDRITNLTTLNEKFQSTDASRFEEGEFRKRVQFMFPGKLVKIQFNYTGKSIEAILDRLPTAQVVSQQEGTYRVEAEVYGKGILMWLLSQGDSIEVLRPLSMRNEMKDMLLQMIDKYRE